jgi:phosphohistidine phosphatase
MLRLIVMRHGEAEPDAGSSDHRRRLRPLGQQDARAVGRKLASAGWTPQAGYVSDARRVLETQACVAESLPGVAWTQSGKLYLSPHQAVLEQLREVANDWTTLMVIGHNPGLSDLVVVLTGEPVRLDTADAALLSVDAGSWADAVEMLGVWDLAGRVGAG